MTKINKIKLPKLRIKFSNGIWFFNKKTKTEKNSGFLVLDENNNVWLKTGSESKAKKFIKRELKSLNELNKFWIK